MGRYRTSSNDTPKDFNNYYNKKKGLVAYKYAITHNSNYNNTNNVNFNMKTTCIGGDNICVKSKNIINYKSYDTLINLSKISSNLNPNCSYCADVPINLMNGITSKIGYNELYEVDCEKTISNNNCPCKKCMKIPIINDCYEKTGKLFPYGHFNNSVKNPSIQIHSLQNIGPCQVNLDCEKYKYCECKNSGINCKCCEYSIITPITNDENIKYTDNSVPDCVNYYNDVPEYMKEHLENLNKMKDERNIKNKELAEKSINIYSKFGNNKYTI